ncbi:dihydrofolate reductase family protein [Halovulum sp. GXIMD14793]
MRHIIYDVAVSLDGYIAASDGDFSAFPLEGDHVAAYQARLQTYDTVLMGRATYEVGYRFGLPPGAKAYPHMDHHIFSQSLSLPEGAEVQVHRDDWLSVVDGLRQAKGGDIYLCGGGQFAGFLEQHGRIDLLRLKRAPILLGQGIPLFAGMRETKLLQLTDAKVYDSGVVYSEYH